MYKIGELSKLTGLSADTLRYYESSGLIAPVERNAAGYRMYKPEAIEHIRFIQRAKAVGFTLGDIDELLHLRLEKTAHSCEEVKHYTEKKLQEVDHKLAELQRIRTALGTLNAACCGGPESAETCSILQALETGEVE